MAEYLTPAGQRRRGEIGALVQRRIRGRRQRRTVRRAVGLAALLLVAGWFGRSLLRSPKPPVSRPTRNSVLVHNRAALHNCRFSRSRNRPDAVAGWVVRNADPAPFFVGDDGLPGLFAAAGHPAGLIRVRGRVCPVVPVADANVPEG